LQGGSSQWESVTYNLPVKQISKIAVSDKFLYAATYNASVWQMPLKVLGIDKLKRNTFTLEVYPNPANTELSVGCSQSADCDWLFAKGDMIKVMDISGKLVESKMINEATENIKISTIDMVNGIYFIQVMKEGNIMTRKFLVMH
jgi:hypothetical protein